MTPAVALEGMPSKEAARSLSKVLGEAQMAGAWWWSMVIHGVSHRFAVESVSALSYDVIDFVASQVANGCFTWLTN